MKQSQALVQIGHFRVTGVVRLRQRMRERAFDDTAAQLRVWMEALERRVMMSASAPPTSTPEFGVQGFTRANFDDVLGISQMWSVAAAADGKLYAAGTNDGWS